MFSSNLYGEIHMNCKSKDLILQNVLVCIWINVSWLLIPLSMLTTGISPAVAFRYITKHTFPNVYMSLQILLTLPISVANGKKELS